MKIKITDKVQFTRAGVTLAGEIIRERSTCGRHEWLIRPFGVQNVLWVSDESILEVIPPQPEEKQ